MWFKKLFTFKEKKALLLSSIGLCIPLLFLLSVPAFAAEGQNIGTIANNLSSFGGSIVKLIKMLGLVSGFGFVFASIFMFINLKKTNTPVIIPTAMLIGGICLISILTIVSIGTNSILGETAGSTSIQEILK